MKHRIYSFPLGQRKANSHTVHRASTVRAQPAGAEPLEQGGSRGGARLSARCTQGFGGQVFQPQPSRRCSNLGFTKEKPANAVWSMESMRFLSL